MLEIRATHSIDGVFTATLKNWKKEGCESKLTCFLQNISRAFSCFIERFYPTGSEITLSVPGSVLSQEHDIPFIPGISVSADLTASLTLASSQVATCIYMYRYMQ